MKQKLLFLSGIVSILITIGSCEYHDLATTEALTDENLFKEIGEGSYQYFRGGQLLSAASASPHGSFKLRFNDIAWSALDDAGNLPRGGTFPEGSIVVKEVYRNSTLEVFAVIKKAKGDPNAGAGWLWNEYATNGTSLFGLMKKGNGCTSCHGDTPNRDLTRSFDLH